MKQEDTLKEFLESVFKDFEATPKDEAWTSIRERLDKRNLAKTIFTIASLCLLFVVEVCYAPTTSFKRASLFSQNASTNVNTAASSDKTTKNLSITPLSKSTIYKSNISIKPSGNKQVTLNRSPKKRDVIIERNLLQEEAINGSKPNETILSETTISPNTVALSLQMLANKNLQILPIHSATPTVKIPTNSTPTMSRYRSKWAVGIMPLMTYQRMYIQSNDVAQIEHIEPTTTFDTKRSGWRVEADLTLQKNDRNAWRIGLNYTQLSLYTRYQLNTGTYALNALNTSPLITPKLEWQQSNYKANLVGLQVARQHYLTTAGDTRYFVGVGMEGAYEWQKHKLLLFAHAMVGIRKSITPHLTMTVEPTVSYSLLNLKVVPNLLQATPYNVGMKVSLGMK